RAAQRPGRRAATPRRRTAEDAVSLRMAMRIVRRLSCIVLVVVGLLWLISIRWVIGIQRYSEASPIEDPTPSDFTEISATNGCICWFRSSFQHTPGVPRQIRYGLLVERRGFWSGSAFAWWELGPGELSLLDPRLPFVVVPIWILMAPLAIAPGYY